MIKKEKTFTIDYQSDEEGEHYSGQFTVKKMSILDVSKVNVRKSQLCGGFYCVRDDADKPTGQGIDEGTDSFNYMIAVLENQLIQKPAWWKLDSISDQGLLSAVFKEVMEFERTFRGRGNRGADTSGESASSSKETSPQESPKAVPGNVSSQVLDL
jgi:hypothetical protein